MTINRQPLHCPVGQYHNCAMTMWLPNLEGRRGPVYRRIADAIDEEVQKGNLRAGARLPPHRDKAHHLRGTAPPLTRAQTQAARPGPTSGHGRGRALRPGTEI